MSNTDSFASGDYVPPTPQEIRDLMSKHNLTGKDIRILCGVNHDQVRRWTAIGQKYTIPYACWRLLLFELGEIRKD